jgi:transcriptional regulator GlxA family with amidase domain
MDIALIAFDGFTDIDLFLPWDLLHRVPAPAWGVRILGTAAEHRSSTGLAVATHGPVDEARHADAVLLASGQGTRALVADPDYLARLALDPACQLVGSMCSGALVLAALGLLTGRTATTYPTAAEALRAYGVTVVEEPFVRHGRVATAAGCLAAQQLVGWVIEELAGPAARELALRSIQPVGVGLGLADADAVSQAYGSPAPARSASRS